MTVKNKNLYLILTEIIFLIGKLHKHQIGLEPMTSPLTSPMTMDFKLTILSQMY